MFLQIRANVGIKYDYVALPATREWKVNKVDKQKSAGTTFNYLYIDPGVRLLCVAKGVSDMTPKTTDARGSGDLTCPQFNQVDQVCYVLTNLEKSHKFEKKRGIIQTCCLRHFENILPMFAPSRL